MIYGYVRVSTDEQNDSMQRIEIERYLIGHGHGVAPDSIIRDVASGNTALATRPGWARLYPRLCRGDTIIVWRLDRITRRLRDLIDFLAWLDKSEIGLVSLHDPIDTRSASGRLVSHVFGALAEFERAQTLERINAGITAARARGVRFGRPAALSLSQAAVIRELHAAGKTMRELADFAAVGRSTIKQVVDRAGPYATVDPC